MAILRQFSTPQSSYCLDLAARVECAQQSAPFHLCSAASFFSIGFLRGGLLRSGRGIWRCVAVQDHTAGAALPDADTQRLPGEARPEVPAARLPCVPPDHFVNGMRILHERTIPLRSPTSRANNW